MNITEPIRRHAEQSPYRVAVLRRNGEALTYREFDQIIDAVARRVSDLGLVAGDTVGLVVKGPFRFLTTMLALGRLGIASAPMSLPGQRMNAYIATARSTSHSSARLVPVDQVWTDEASAPGNPDPLPLHDDGAAVFGVFSSSGTTGMGKHVAITHDMIGRRIHSRGLMVPLPDCAVQIALIGLGAHFGFKSIVRVLWAGGRVVLPGDLDKVASLIEREQVNHLVLAPARLNQLIASMPQGMGPFPFLKTIEFGGSLLPQRLYDIACARLCPNIVSLYGTTESGAIAAAPMAQLVDKPGAVGYVHPGVEIETVDANDEPLPRGTQGNLRVRSVTCVGGYVGAAFSAAAAFRGGWFYPGDVGTVSGDGLLILAGRADEVVNIGGFKVSPHVVEDVLLSVAAVRDAAAFGVPDTDGFMKIGAAIVPDGPVEVEELMEICRQRLSFSAPRFIIKLKKIPRNPAGKILRGKLAQLAIAIQTRKASE